MKRFSLVLSLLAVAILPFFLVSTTAAHEFTGIEFFAFDRSESNSCAGCHFFPGNAVMPFTVDTWLESDHANSYRGFLGNTYCARCHSPFQADPLATHGENEDVPSEEWEAVTCGACHPPHDLRVEWGTPIGIYDVDAGEWSPVNREDVNDLCLHCHSGEEPHNEPVEFQGFGKVMYEKKGVRCIDCHMAKVPNTVVAEETWRHAHDMGVGGDVVEGPEDDGALLIEDKEQYSCGTIPGGCHDNKTKEWALKQLEKQKIHGKK
jgi:hypothetical protein